jgi:hypothetical protein
VRNVTEWASGASSIAIARRQGISALLLKLIVIRHVAECRKETDDGPFPFKIDPLYTALFLVCQATAAAAGLPGSKHEEYEAVGDCNTSKRIG